MFEKVQAIIAKQLNADPEILTPKTNLMKELDVDSLDIVEIVLALEEEFDIEIPDEDADSFQTVQDLVDFIEGSN